MKPKLIIALSNLNKEEWISFRKYLLMYTGIESDNFHCFTLLQREKNRLENFNAAKWHQKHFTHMSSKAFFNVLSRLYQWLEEWIVYYAVKQDQNQIDAQLVKWYNRRGLYNIADQRKRRALKRIDQKDKYDLESGIALHQLHYFTYYSDNPAKYSERGKLLDIAIEQYQKVVYDQLMFYTIEMKNWGRITKYDYSKTEQNFLKIIELLIPSENQNILLTLKKVVDDYDLEAFSELKQKLLSGAFETQSDLHPLITLYTMVYTLRLWGRGKQTGENPFIDILNYGMKSKVLFAGNKIPQVRFHNLITTIAAFETSEVTQLFIDTWYLFVNAKNPESTRKLAMAQTFYYHEKFEDVITQLRDVEFNDYLTKIRAMDMYIIALYSERSSLYDLFLNIMENYKRFLKRNRDKISPKKYRGSRNLIDIVEKLSGLNKKSIDINIEDYDVLNHRQWALKEIKRRKK